MPSNSARILCIGEEQDLLQLRCAVLSKSGYEAQSVRVREALNLLQTETFDLIILSSRLSNQDRDRILAAVDRASVIVLNGVTFPKELLSEVAKRLEFLGRAV